jgi:glycine/D-amino acid oxidase-like deaminating enzyme
MNTALDDQTHVAQPHVIIVGGGVGGLAAARALKNAPVLITLLDRLNHHLFQPLPYQVATIATPETLIPWYHRLMAQKTDGSPLRRPRVLEAIEQLVVQMAEKNATWGYRRIHGALANLGHPIDAITVRNILRRPHLEPAPQRRKAGMSWQKFLKLH